ncbi:type II toxin-antitoxin system HicB family antitoxin [Croceitalea sp. MTPC5]|uniref:Type II toxin-antitoxin system HicB family antitoxin n=1 Tax=Croceitalea marina TaxID=1775166 RepID=A0ABW5MY91_9FLAO|nr:type II toxin-antitoxin system HicB family antitoxin [Croceitalea sp. MTPC5]
MRKTLKYLVVYEKSADGFGAYVPDLPGCTSAGKSRDEIESNIIEAITLHLEIMQDEGLPIPQPNSDSQMVVIT